MHPLDLIDEIYERLSDLRRHYLSKENQKTKVTKKKKKEKHFSNSGDSSNLQYEILDGEAKEG